jgi:hypothetical protein
LKQPVLERGENSIDFYFKSCAGGRSSPFRLNTKKKRLPRGLRNAYKMLEPGGGQNFLPKQMEIRQPTPLALPIIPVLVSLKPVSSVDGATRTRAELTGSALVRDVSLSDSYLVKAKSA